MTFHQRMGQRRPSSTGNQTNYMLLSTSRWCKDEAKAGTASNITLLLLRKFHMTLWHDQQKPTTKPRKTHKFCFSSFEKSDFYVPAASTKHLAPIHTLQHEYGGMAVPHIVRRHPVALYNMKRQNCCFQTSVFVQIFVSGLCKCLRSACHVISWLLLHHSFSSCNKIKWSLEMFFLGAMFHATSHQRRPRHTMGDKEIKLQQILQRNILIICWKFSRMKDNPERW